METTSEKEVAVVMDILTLVSCHEYSTNEIIEILCPPYLEEEVYPAIRWLLQQGDIELDIDMNLKIGEK